MKRFLLYLLISTVCLTSICAQTDADGVRTWDKGGRMQTDICVYGATSGGIIAALTAKRMGKSVVLLEPSRRIGGLTTGGLGKTDVGRVEIIQGLALEFYRRVGTQYGKDKAVFDFEPKVALAAYEEMLREDKLLVQMERRVKKVKKQGNRIREIILEDASSAKRPALCIEAKEFIDCSYEGDLMARAGVTYTVGRESNSVYGETYNGMQMLNKHQFPDGVDPYREKGNPKSGLLWGILKGEMGQTGKGDKRVQAYNFRITLTNDPQNRIPITRPEGYDSTRYELLLRWKEVAPWNSKNLRDCFAWDLMTNPTKTDINNNQAFSTDMIGCNWDYPEASYKKRERIHKEHLEYTKGLLWFVTSDPRIPAHIRQQISQWGYPKDEYPESNHFTPQLYIRESRRMIGRYVMTQANCQQDAVANDVVGWGAYTMDSHNCGRYVVNGMVKNCGDVQIHLPKGKYNISYRSLTPRQEEADNLLVPFCLSASHIAFGSIRMEPVFMVLSQSSVIAASLAIDQHEGCVQQVNSQQVMKIFPTITGN
ncbi:MAG: FAD-dependent oxidoreductase [Bacteroidaceae bacterium]